MKASELVRKVKADGWVLYRHGKKHDVYIHPTKSGQLVIPRHNKELATGTLKALLEIADLGK
ncbi:MAG: type II toxin-antitoxin system HicA family toxin [Chloroflexi bacterium]|nr:type II toxin-antitoxin system HicA family toxin [Chloroflexota bacterium]